jgi:hypothetical protein
MAKAAYWAEPDTEARKCGEQTGLDTRVVHTLNDAYWSNAGCRVGRSQRDKYAAWEVRPQG